MAPYKGLLILGFGGHARSIADVALSYGIEQLLFIDTNGKEGETFLGFPVLKTMNRPLEKGWQCLPASGDNRHRKLQVDFIKSQGWPLATLISRTATIGFGSLILPGSFVAHHAHIGPLTEVGIGSIINSGAIVEHDCTIGHYTHISIRSSIAGNSVIGDLCTLFAGSVVSDSLTICDNVTVGAGGVVIHPIKEPGLYVGVPAQQVKKAP